MKTPQGADRADAETLQADFESPALSSTYSMPSDGYDEMCSAPAVLRPHWQELMRSLDGMGAAELHLRRDEVQRLLQENGVTFNVFDEPRGAQRPWVIDPIPLLMTGEEWQAIEAGLQQKMLIGSCRAAWSGFRPVWSRTTAWFDSPLMVGTRGCWTARHP